MTLELEGIEMKVALNLLEALSLNNGKPMTLVVLIGKAAEMESARSAARSHENQPWPLVVDYHTILQKIRSYATIRGPPGTRDKPNMSVIIGMTTKQITVYKRDYGANT
ncbi:hypothetical protein HYV85_02115 [Candidatus Woesearchaeota archaeon]|nr:hypothetical protein [Candidatus Woesearchaeota archaeon]